MTRLIDADALQETICRHDYILRDSYNSTDKGMFTHGILYAIAEQPTIDAVAVVRCKDRKYSLDYYHDGDCYCKKPTREMLWIGSTWDGFCSSGERRESND